MPENALFAQILSDYEQQKAPKKTALNAAKEFCDFAAQWLQTSGVVGVGHTVSGLSMRMANGSEYLLFSPAANEQISFMPAIGITGNSGGAVRAAGPQEAASSFPITG
jgi:hypothetical protein